MDKGEEKRWRRRRRREEKKEGREKEDHRYENYVCMEFEYGIV